MVNRKLVTALVLVLLSVALPVTSARQTDIRPIANGETLDGKIRSTDVGDIYSFEGRAGDAVTLIAFSDFIDVYLRVADPNGDTIAENDDIDNTTTAAGVQFDLPADGVYYAVVLGYDTGPYSLSLEITAAPIQSGNQTSSFGEGVIGISYGDQIQGQAVNLDNPIIYSFSGRAGDTVNITVTSSAIDPYVVVADASGNGLGENDDISSNDTNAFLQVVLPANGDYIIGVYGYSAGPFTLTLEQANGTLTPTGASDAVLQGDITNGQINANQWYVEIPIRGVRQGETIIIDSRATGGDLDLYLGLLKNDEVVVENDDRDQSTTDARLEYPNAAAGDYVVVVTRYGFDQGETTGSFEVAVKVGQGANLTVSSGTGNVPVDLAAVGYPRLPATPAIAEWTVLVYMGGDNNLEDGLINDLDEFEVAGGSTPQVRIAALFDRSRAYDRSNGNWTDTRLFEVGRDTTGDARFNYPPTIDTRPVGNLGELDTSYGNNLRDFLIWGVQSFPARRYAVIINDHGGAWTGTVTDDTSGQGILSLPELDAAFRSALQATGLQKFNLLINDACLMSSVEHFAMASRYFDYALASPEITLNPSFDMTLLTTTLNRNPNVDMAQLGQLMVDKYLQDMQAVSADTLPVLGAAATDLRRFDAVVSALNQFTQVVNSNPDAYVSLLGQIRANSYAYSFFLPEAGFGAAENIDLGNFMVRLMQSSNDAQLTTAARDVLSALSGALLYGNAGPQLKRQSTYYNIYFPSRPAFFNPAYLQESPLTDWTDFLRGFFGSARPRSAGLRSVVGAPPADVLEAPSVAPAVTITNQFPAETSIAFPTKVAMEVTGRNIIRGDFTVDQLQPDGTLIRLETSRIVTEVVTDGVADYVNLWHPGVDDSTFNWNVLLPVVTDGETISYEQVVTTDNQSSIAGRYHYPDDPTWVEVTVMFDSDGNTANVVSRNPGTTALASVRVEPGGEFQAYRSIVTPDGRVQVEPGTTFTWPEGGILWDYEPAPSGQYNLGFLVEATGGLTGFASTPVRVNNEGVNPALRGYMDQDWGFVFQRPAQDWYDVNYFPDDSFLQTSSFDSSQYMFVYSAADAGEDPEAAARQVLEKFSMTQEGSFTPVQIGGLDGLEFRYKYSNDSGEFTGRAVAVYQPKAQLALVFAAEALDSVNTDRLYQLFLDHLMFFDPTGIKAADRGVWTRDTYGQAKYPVAESWMPGFEDGLWWTYQPDNASSSPIRASVSVLNPMDVDAAGMVDVLLDEENAGRSGYSLLGKQTYYGEANTWESAQYTIDGPGGQQLTGQLYVTVKDGTPYALRFEAPTEEFNRVFRQTFTVMLDGFKIEEVKTG